MQAKSHGPYRSDLEAAHARIANLEHELKKLKEPAESEPESQLPRPGEVFCKECMWVNDGWRPDRPDHWKCNNPKNACKRPHGTEPARICNVNRHNDCTLFKPKQPPARLEPPSPSGSLAPKRDLLIKLLCIGFFFIAVITIGLWQISR